MTTLRWPYRPKPVVMALAGLFFAGCGVVLFKMAQGNDRGLILNGLIEFGVGGATIFYWVLTACCVAFVAGAMLGFVRAFGATREIVLDDRTLSAPRTGMGTTIVTVPLATITGIELRAVGRQRFLTVRHTGGKLAITGSMLPAKGDLEELAVEIDRRRAVPGKTGIAEAAASPVRQFGRRDR